MSQEIHGTYSSEPGEHAEPAESPEPEATRRAADEAESSRASRGWWDRNADEYQSDH
ncbi:SAM-dependent methyltransferase, partial [Streptomyces sp. SID4931]